MPAVSKLLLFGNQLKIIYDDASVELAYPTTGGIWYAPRVKLQEIGNQIAIIYGGGNKDIAYPSAGGYWNVKPGSVTPPTGLTDTLLPGHVFAEGSLYDDWMWHINNANNRGGSDLNYIFEPFYAPAPGMLSTFDVGGVGMVAKLILDTPAVRTQPQFPYDQPGPMVAIWFQHNSAAAPDGHVNTGDYIGTSGDGYGDYPAHLHVHGLIDTGNVASNTNRTCFWNFL